MFKNSTVFINTLISLFISQLIFWLVFLNLTKLPPVIPLWFQQPWGQAQLAAKTMIWYLPGLAAGILAADLLITALIYRRQPFLVGIIMSICTISNLYLLIATLNILNRVFGWI